MKIPRQSTRDPLKQIIYISEPGILNFRRCCHLAQNKNDLLVPAAQPRLDVLKYELATELGYPLHIGAQKATPQNWNQITDQMKYEIAAELGLTPRIQNGYWGNLSSRDCGAVGGRMGGKLGGNMVRRMILYAQQNMIR